MVVHDEADAGGGGALAAVSRESGVMALAMMGEAEFEARLAALKLGRERVARIQRELLVGPTPDNPEGEDYGVIPGTIKPTLLKPGAEKICNVYGLVPVFEETWIEGDGVSTPHLRVRIKCRLHRGDENGPVAGQGLGAANSWEKKHRYRGAKRACPSCGCEGTIKRSSFEKDGDKGWYCHGKAGGCGATFHSADPAITEQQGGQVDNPDPYDVENTLLKMASKRAQVDATLRVTATSGLFTQDVEDQAGDAGPGPAAGGAPAPAGTAPAPAPQSRPAPAGRPATASQAQRSSGGPLPRWTGPCPRCGKTGSVIVSKMKAGFYHCWKKNGGCDYDFTPEDAQVHSGAAAERAAGDRQPGEDG
jgi:ssDNA-binding Zn-finger/Zn-ribbon topoisomerase 1